DHRPRAGPADDIPQPDALELGNLRICLPAQLSKPPDDIVAGRPTGFRAGWTRAKGRLGRRLLERFPTTEGEGSAAAARQQGEDQQEQWQSAYHMGSAGIRQKLRERPAVAQRWRPTPWGRTAW